MQSYQSSTTAYIHEGLAFEYSGEGTIAASGTTVFLGRTGALPVHFHAFEVVTSKGPVRMELIEAPTVSNTGTQQTPKNRRRSTLDLSDMRIYSGATITGGTVLGVRKIHDVGGGAHVEGGDAGFISEWILKPNMDYAFRLTNLDTVAAVDYAATFFYYELGV